MDVKIVKTLIFGEKKWEMGKIVIDYGETGSKQKVCEVLQNWINSESEEKLEIQLIHVVSADFEEDFDVDECTDFNGWQCDWWSNLNYNGYKFNLYGEAWYGRILITGLPGYFG